MKEIMSDLLPSLLAIPIGITSSFVTWWILNQFFIPKITFSKKISKIEDQHSKSGYRYRVKMKNCGRRDIIDIVVICRVCIGNRYKSAPETVSFVKLKTSNATAPFMKKYGKDRVIALYPEKVKAFEEAHYAEPIRLKALEGRLSLEDILDIENSYLLISVFAYDGYSGARKLFTSHEYRKEDIVEARFVKGQLDVQEVADPK